jgi:hypothetical protein
MILKRFYSPDDSGGADDKEGDAKGGAKGENDDGDGGADTEDDDQDDQGDDDDKGKKGETVAKADHQRALDDLARFKKEARTLKQRNDELDKRLKALEKGKTPDGEDWKKKYEDAEEKNSRLKQNFVDGEKYKALVPALHALGLRKGGEKLIDLIDLEDLEVEMTDRGRVTILNVEDFAKKVKRDNDWAFDAKKSSKVNSGGGGDSGGNRTVEWTAEKLVEYERECKRKGEPEKYKKAYQQFLEQRSAKRKQA